MSLREKYLDRIEETLGAVGVWEPGEAVSLGTILKKADDGRYVAYGSLSSYFSGAKRRSANAGKLAVSSSHVSHQIFQGVTPVPDPTALAPNTAATLEISLAGQEQFILITPILRRSWYSNVDEIAVQLSVDPRWDNDEFYLVHEVYRASDFYFAGTENSVGSMTFTGMLSGLLELLRVGASVSLGSTSTVAINLQGKGGMIAMGLVQFEDDGDTEFLP